MTWYDTGACSSNIQTLLDLPWLRDSLARWNPNARGVLLAGALIGVRHRGGVAWLRAASERGVLLPTDPRVVRGLQTIYVSFLPRKIRGGAYRPERRRAFEGSGLHK